MIRVRDTAQQAALEARQFGDDDSSGQLIFDVGMTECGAMIIHEQPTMIRIDSDRYDDLVRCQACDRGSQVGLEVAARPLCHHGRMADARTVVILPGRTFGAYVPQLFFPMFAAMRRGAEPVAVTWPAEVDGVPPARFSSWVAAQVSPVLRGCDPTTTLVIGKSLGSYAGGLTADLGIPAIWVTPVLTSDEIVAGLRRSTAPFMLVGGTADPVWNSSVARELTRHVVVVDGGDHGLFDPGPLARSARNVGVLADACERFLDEVVWPDPLP